MYIHIVFDTWKRRAADVADIIPRRCGEFRFERAYIDYARSSQALWAVREC